MDEGRVYYSRKRDTWAGRDKLNALHGQSIGIEYLKHRRRYRICQLEDLSYEFRKPITDWMNHIELNRTIKLMIGGNDERGG